MACGYERISFYRQDRVCGNNILFVPTVSTNDPLFLQKSQIKSELAHHILLFTPLIYKNPISLMEVHVGQVCLEFGSNSFRPDLTI